MKYVKGTITYLISVLFILLDLTVASVLHNLISGIYSPTVFGYLIAAVLTFFSTPAVISYLFKDDVIRRDSLAIAGKIGVILSSIMAFMCYPFGKYMATIGYIGLSVMYLMLIKYTEKKAVV